MEDMPSAETSSEETPPSNDVPDDHNKSRQIQTSNPQSNGCLNLFRCCCCKGSNQGISRNKIEPVIFKPMNDVYLQLKPHRRLRVIHINGQGALPTPTPYYLQNLG